MTRTRLLLGLVLACSLVAGQSTASIPAITGEVRLIEICPQFICGKAIFAGEFDGEVGLLRNAKGTAHAAVQHTSPLPDDPLDDPALITGGKWTIIVNRRFYFAGQITAGGTIKARGDNTFDVDAILQLEVGGSGQILLTGLLDHTELPFTLVGTLLQ